MINYEIKSQSMVDNHESVFIVFVQFTLDIFHEMVIWLYSNWMQKLFFIIVVIHRRERLGNSLARCRELSRRQILI